MARGGGVRGSTMIAITERDGIVLVSVSLEVSLSLLPLVGISPVDLGSRQGTRRTLFGHTWPQAVDELHLRGYNEPIT